MDLKAPNVLGCRGLWRSPEKGGKAPDETDVIALGLFPQAAHGHVFEHAPTQRADGRGGWLLGHRICLTSLKDDPSCSEPDTLRSTSHRSMLMLDLASQ